MSRIILIGVLIVLIVGAIVTPGQCDDEEQLKKCGDETKILYEKACAATNRDAEKIRAIKDKCIKFPAELDENVIAIMKECDQKNNPCDEKAMATCGEEMLPKADAQFSENRKKDGKKPASLMELYNDKKKDLAAICETVKKCIEENSPK
ncbi:hypothetical protein HDE_13246 [Halotydeus destructor]|nr:hypothetical protein HDE_13246 [Halotydeus destructor]